MEYADENNVIFPPQRQETVRDSGNLPEDKNLDEASKKPQLQLDEQDLKEIKLTTGEIEEVLKVKLNKDATKGSSGPEEKDITD